MLLDKVEMGVIRDAAAAVAHGVAVLAHDKGLFRVFSDELFDVHHRGVHLALHVGGGGVFPLLENALVVHKSAGVGAAKILAHLPQRFPAVALVAAGPDQDGDKYWGYGCFLLYKVSKMGF